MPAKWTSFISNVSNLISSGSSSDAKDFGEKLAKEYVKAVKNSAQSPTGQIHSSSPGEQVFITQYGLLFKKISEEGDGTTFEEKQTDSDYANLEPAEPGDEGIAYEEDAEFDKFIEDNKNSLHTFNYFEFPRLSGNETIEDLAKLFATRYLIKFYKLNANQRVQQSIFLDFLKNNDADKMLDSVAHGKAVQSMNAAKIYTQNALTTLTKRFATICINSILEAHPNSLGNGTELAKRFRSNRVKDYTKPAIPKKPLRMQVMQESYEDNPNMPPILGRQIIVLFTPRNVGTSLLSDWVLKESYVKEEYETELKDYWQKCPNVSTKQEILNATGGTLFKYTQSQVSAEEESDESKEDVYLELANATLLYWQSTITLPLRSNPPVLPCTLTAPLGGIYIPVSYGSAAKLANNLRRAMNTGKRFEKQLEKPISSKLVAVALAYSYMVHLSQLKFVYLGGVPSIVGPVPMIGFVPLVM